ncbi:MAG: UbiH/UbiF/VisC/COQ6 family ubiquinone biosynthesis hydroxylase [Gammaproteobacteria bacterium]
MIQAQTDSSIVIAGGGIVGMTLALALGRAGIPVDLVERRLPELDWPAGSVDLRVYAITRASERLFAELGIWDDIASVAVSSFHKMHVWDAGGSGQITFDAAEVGQPWLGNIIESRIIVRALYKALKTIDVVTLHCPAKVVSMCKLDDTRSIELDSGQILTTGLLVGADGKQSDVRDHAGIKDVQKSYQQQAMVAVVSTELSHQSTAWQRFLPTGPLAFLPLRDGRSSIVWSATTAEAKHLLQLDDAAFCQALSEAFDFRLGAVTDCSERVLFPLVRQHAEQYVGQGVALVGDAAHVIHPLAGQGVNLGLSDVRELASVIKAAVGKRQNPGSLANLRRYERARKGDNLAMMTAMTAFKELFGSTVSPLRLLRNLGLNLINDAKPIKHQIMRSAMGLE